ncbi:MAG: tetratricopeptide repeat protein [Phycisphaerales bacterium]
MCFDADQCDVHPADELDPVQAAFVSALKLPADQRGAWLANTPLPDAARREVEDLLAADETSGGSDMLLGVVDRGIAELCSEMHADIGRSSPADFTPIEGTQIGRYRIGPLLGEGGFAVVHEAEQHEPVHRTVALKLLKPGMDSAAVLARFDAERQALAMMQHPGIAAVLDGGVTERGLPYFVMECVRGAPITAFADAGQVPIADRLELFARVCDAVQHAHQKGVVHRDLKPANILVETGDGSPRPRVIDFGIAKALEGPLIDRPAATRSGQLIGTPGYMSPEQVLGGGLDVDTRADVHALGVVLHVLLTGSLPIPVDGQLGPAELARMVLEADPPRPSDRVAALDADAASAIASARATTPAELRRRLRRDLDWVCLRAIARDRDRRYASVSELAADVRRSIDGQLVSAGPPTLGYRLRTFVRRRRIEVASVAAVVLVAGAAAIVGAQLAWDAARARDEQAAVAGFLDEFILTASPFAVVAGDAPAGGEDGASRNDILRDRLDDASELVSVELQQWPAAQAKVHLTLAHAMVGFGTYERVAEEAGIALRLSSDHIGRNAPETFDAMALLGRAQWNLTQYAEATELLTPGLEAARRALGPDDPITLVMANNLALVHRSSGRHVDARELHRDTMERRDRVLGPDDPQTLISRSNYARALQVSGDLETALSLQRSVHASQVRQLGEHNPETLVTLDQTGTLLADLGRLEEAKLVHEASVAGLSASLGPRHESTQGARFFLARTLSKLGDHAAAEARLRTLWTECHDEYGEDDRYTTTILMNLGDAVRRQGRPDETIELVDGALQRAIAASGWELSQTWALARTAALAEQDRGEHAAARDLLEQILESSAGRIAADDARSVELRIYLAASRAALGERAEARADLEREIDVLLGYGLRTSEALPRGLEALADILEADGDAEGAAEQRALSAELQGSAAPAY